MLPADALVFWQAGRVRWRKDPPAWLADHETVVASGPAVVTSELFAGGTCWITTKRVRVDKPAAPDRSVTVAKSYATIWVALPEVLLEATLDEIRSVSVVPDADEPGQWHCILELRSGRTQVTFDRRRLVDALVRSFEASANARPLPPEFA